jgi:hypothetical protein
MYRLFLLFWVSCTACTTLAQHPAPQHRLSPDSEAHRRHVELELVWEQPAGRQDLITFIVDGTTRAASKLARFSQSLYGQLARVFLLRCPVRCLDAAWRILVQEVQPNVVVIAHGKERTQRLAVVGVYYIGERSDYGVTVLSQLAAERITATLLRRQAREASRQELPLPQPSVISSP